MVRHSKCDGALGVTKINFYVPIVPLPPALDSYWLVIHILVAVLAVNRPRDLTQGRRVMLNDLQIDADRLADPAVSIKDATC